MRPAFRGALLFAAMMLCCWQASYAQTAAAYTFTRGAGVYTSIVGGPGTVTTTGLQCDDCNETGVPLGFTFTFCGTAYTTCAINSNGVVSLSNSYATCCGINASVISGAGYLMPMWTDLWGAPGTFSPSAHYQTSGTPGSRVFTMEWNNWSGFPDVGLQANFQVKLYEGTNVVQFCYGPRAGTYGSTIGIANGTTDFQTLPSDASPTCNTTFNAYACTMPASGDVLTWSPGCIPGSMMPAPVPMTGGGGYCSGGAGVSVGLAGSAVGINYQLYLGGVPVGSPFAGIGAGFSFGMQTAPGVYTATATNPSTGCTTTMPGSVTVIVYTLPGLHTVTGGGNYCAGGTGVAVGLDGSDIGVKYQLYRGGLPIVSTILNGTGLPLTWGMQTVAGTYTVVAKSASFTGCTNTMTGSAVVVVDPLPLPFTVTGGGSYCLGGVGMNVNLSGSVAGVTYQLYRGGIATGLPVAGTGAAISFGPQTVAGTYTVKGTDDITGCVRTMISSVNVNIIPLPTAFTVLGGGGYCAGGTGLNIYLSSSTIGVNYQLIRGGVTPVGSPVAGTSGAISFGAQTVAGVYTIQATHSVVGCQNMMAGSATIAINPLPTAFNVTGGGNFCASGPGLPVGVDNSETGVNYRLYRGTIAMGGPVAGTGSAISFGNQTIPGVYTVIATNVTTGCVNTMTGSATIVVNTIPAPVNVGGGGAYCAGGTGVNIYLYASAVGINYQLYIGVTPIGSPVAGTGTALSLGLQTTAGTYTVQAINPITGCTNTMTGSATVIINPLPPTHTVTGGGSYCSGGTGVTIGLSGSNSGIKYQLYRGGSPVVGTIVFGTGGAITFPAQTVAGTYTVLATNAGPSGCTNFMTGSTTVSINPLPTAYTLSSSGGYCSGGSGSTISLSNSDVGTNYQLYMGITAVGSPVAGTGSSISFGSFTTGGVYTCKGTNTTTGCVGTMSGSATVTILPLPYAFYVLGGGSYCTGGTGVTVSLGGSVTGTSYQLYVGGTPTGSPIAGTGSTINFGLQTTTGTYTVVATNTTTLCTNNMIGSVTVNTVALPTPMTVTGGGGYCAGGTGVAVGVASSQTGVVYQLYRGGTPIGSPITGTGSAISYGLQTVAGVYTVVATAIGTLCSNSMTGSVTVVVNPLPRVDTVVGGGGYCTGGGGVNVYLDSSQTGVNYQLYRGTTPVGSPVAGTGFPISFGAQTTAGTYTVVATDATTSCVRTMAGSATVTISGLPTAYSVVGGGAYCTGGTGLPVYLSGSQTGVSYQLYVGATPSGSPMTGTGAALSFGIKTAPGVYTVVATNITAGCVNTMTGSVTITVNPVPNAYTVTGGGSYCAGGTGLAVGLGGSDAGINYRLYRSGTAIGSVVPGTGSALSFGLQTAAGTYTVIATDATTGCTATMTGSVTITVSTLPAAVLVTGGGGYCVGGTGVPVGLAGSAVGVNYQLYRGGTPVGSPVAGAGTSISFGLQTTAGVYTVVGTIGTSSCTNTMTGSATVYVNALPNVYTVTGGGGYCTGGGGVRIYLSGSDAGVSYKLFRGGTPVGSPLAGTGAALDFGLFTAAGTYTVVAVMGGTSCTSSMTGSATVSINPLPTVSGTIYTVAPGSSITFTGSIGGGTWSSMNTAICTIDPSTGVITGISLGGTLISYILPTGCGGAHTVAVTATGFKEGPDDNTVIAAEAASDIHVMPNPNKGIFTVKGALTTTADAAVTLTVTDMVGRTIYTTTTTAVKGTLNEKIDLGNTASGMYLLTLNSDGEHKVFHVVVGQQ